MQTTLTFITDFLADLASTLNFLNEFWTNPKIVRLRVFLVWSIVALVPSLLIYFTINTWQVHIPGIEAVDPGNNNTLVSMIVGTSILPVLFFFTKGLRGYHTIFNYLIEAVFSRFELTPIKELIEKYGEEEAAEKIKKVNIAKYISAFVILEFIIVGWAVLGYVLFGGNMTGLGWFGYVSDDLLLGATVFVLEGVYCVLDGFVEGAQIYRVKLPFISKSDEEADKWIEATEDITANAE